MRNIVFVLGAGASRDAGGPLLEDFFAKKGHRSRRIHEKHYDSYYKYRFLESVFRRWSEIEISNPHGPRSPQSNLEMFYRRLYELRSQNRWFRDPDTGWYTDSNVAEKWLKWYISTFVEFGTCKSGPLNRCYRGFASHLKQLRNEGKNVSVLSFNYDLVLERALQLSGCVINYCVKPSSSGGHNWPATESEKSWHQNRQFCQVTLLNPKGIKLLKLHGSLNWLGCNRCGALEVFKKSAAVSSYWKTCSRDVAGDEHCDGMMEVAILPPIAEKSRMPKWTADLWRQARAVLRDADRMVVIGYSAPEADTMARRMLKQASRRTRHLEIVNPSYTDLNRTAELLWMQAGIGNSPRRYIPIPLTFKEYVSFHC